ncbi:MAG TPA: trehalose-6-phosphate synthase [Burkholderiales bacterium]|nr:trehalose-6-phosphate synthase [Burkholderiales bacterium]
MRFIIPLGIVLAAIAYAVIPLVDRLMLTWFVRDLDARSALISAEIKDPLLEALGDRVRGRTVAFLSKVTLDERLFAAGYCDSVRGVMIATRTLPADIACKTLDRFEDPEAHVLQSAQGPLHVSVTPVVQEGAVIGKLVLVHDVSFVQRRSEETKRYVFYFFVALGAIVSLVTVIVAQLSWRGWMQGFRALLRGEGLLRPAEKINVPELRPLARDLRSLIREVESGIRPRDESQLSWTPETLRGILREDLRGDDILVVSNREPYLHVRRNGAIDVRRPPSGLVTALEPIMRACSGTWIAHGSGNADAEVVDRNDRVAVPPGKPAYAIRRIWLTKEEEAGYYDGFANEGLWPLCHIAHVRPIFRTDDWKAYTEVNRKFARAVFEEAKTDDPIVLVQDYHLALLPRMIRDQLPDATIVTFWHIPWPNPETFAICPWRAELLDGMLGSSILGFHTQFHCNNFNDTVDRVLEARVDRETFTISYGGKLTAVKRYPISIEWPADSAAQKPVGECRAEVRKRHGLAADHVLGIGIDRMDYTKGIIERLLAVERFLEQSPDWIGRFSFLQIAAPTRANIGQYQEFEIRVRAQVARINMRFARDDYVPVILKAEHHEPDQVNEYLRAADVCIVSSLHDGMNLVAKEFIAARDDEHGVLILSQFTGAARELPEALIVNPYDIDQCAAALHVALSMSPVEQRERMRTMRALVREFNVYRWAGRMLLDAAGMRRHGRLLERAAERRGER